MAKGTPSARSVSCSSEINFRENGKHSCQEVPTGSRRITICERAREERSNLGNHTTMRTKQSKSNALSYEQFGNGAELIDANMELARKKAWDLHKNLCKDKGTYT